LRTASNNGRDFNPRAFQVFGPKVTVTSTGQQTAALDTGREEVIPIVQENLQVGKRDVNMAACAYGAMSSRHL
jgi:hypothetical protein